MTKRAAITRRFLGTTMGTALLAAAGGFSRGSVVVYDNSDGAFFWKLGIHDVNNTLYPGTILDITQPATQTGEQRSGTLGKWYYPNQASDEPALRRLIGEEGAQAAKTTAGVTIDWNGFHFTSQHPTRDYAPGEVVTESDNWGISSTYFYHLPFSYSLEEGTPAIGDPAYLGVRVKMTDNQWHYGWIYFTEYQWPVKWAYETEAIVPIQVPVPAPAAVTLMSVAGLGLCSRRRSI